MVRKPWIIFFSGVLTPTVQAVENPHIILLDLKLPKVSGVEVLRHIKGIKRTASMPVVVLTVSNEHVRHCRMPVAYRGRQLSSLKPVNFTDLAQARRRRG